jgi:hypothetical protein
LGGIDYQLLTKPKSIYINNITKNELDICNKIKYELLFTNVTVENKNITNDNNSYDVCLYFAILHHILKVMTFDDIIKMVLKQTKKYAIIELPFDNDILLKTVMNNGTLNYDLTFGYLKNVDTFTEYISKYFTLHNITKIDYKTNELNRFSFTLEKK